MPRSLPHRAPVRNSTADRIIVLSPRPASIFAGIANRPCEEEALIFETAARLLRAPCVAHALRRCSQSSVAPGPLSQHAIARLTCTI